MASTPSPQTATGGAHPTAREPPRHFNQADLARRWRVSPRTLERWRWLGQGPAYLKLGGSVSYRLEDVLAYEKAQRQPAGGR